MKNWKLYVLLLGTLALSGCWWHRGYEGGRGYSDRGGPQQYGGPTYNRLPPPPPGQGPYNNGYGAPPPGPGGYNDGYNH